MGLVAAGCQAPSSPDGVDISCTRAVTDAASMELCADTIIAQMTVEQRVAQLIQGEIRGLTPDDVRKYGLGSVLNGGGAFPGGNKDSSCIF